MERTGKRKSVKKGVQGNVEREKKMVIRKPSKRNTKRQKIIIDI